MTVLRDAQVKAQFKRRSTANNVEIYIPVPEDADSPKFRAAVGTVHYVPEKSAFVWRIKQLPGGKDLMMRAHFGLPSVRGGASFSNFPPTFCTSGPCVRSGDVLLTSWQEKTHRGNRQAGTHHRQVRDSVRRLFLSPRYCTSLLSR